MIAVSRQCVVWPGRVALALGLFLIPLAAEAQSLVDYASAATVGLERAWFAQVRVDVSRHRVAGWTLFADNLIALTSGGVLHSLNAETGETLWVTQAVPVDQHVAGPAVNKKHVAVVSGATLYVMDRTSGRLRWDRALGSAPAAAPAVSDNYAYVSFLNGRIEAHNFEAPEIPTWYFQSIGRVFHSPTTSTNFVSWPSDRGFLYVGQADTPHVLYRIETDSPATAPPTEAHSQLYVTAADGLLYCFQHTTGREVWRYSMGFPANSRPAVVGDRIYVASSEPMLHALDAHSGELLWSSPGITQFVSQGIKNVYGLDDRGQFVIIGKKSGKRVGTLPGAGYQAVFNEQSDRIFLFDKRGLVQCLHEMDAVEPTMYQKSEDAEKAEEPTDAAMPFVEETQPTQPEVSEPAAEDTEVDTFEEPAEEPGDEGDNPFSFGE